ncbi:hypothetical protein [Clostridium manihotivorum]|uniref:CN hydrolase domain-containing protein n=1 Tax=Clostridium manihotivorum TaxID=2320868 RepID=A0A410DTU6_9CLOT|nr:hypothetical protein [Clostridium manihotivorum]QAA32479.1 hypothetical protein C1I91_12970 [Clostridium manihotivorum]
MRILVGQPVREKGIAQITNEIVENSGVDIVIYPEGYLADEKALEGACELAKKYEVIIITSYLKDKKNRAIIIDCNGVKVLERAKTLPQLEQELIEPLDVKCDEINIGYLLCMEILKGERDLKKVKRKIDFVANPIGVGMYSEEQFEQWINEAKNIAKTYKTMVIGTSHADGSYKNCGVSIPVSYCINSDGEPIYISKRDTRTRIIDINTKEYLIKL